MAETSKARARRLQSGFFENYCQGRGIDIGVGRIDSPAADPVLPDVDTWDQDDGDATFMKGVPDETYDFVYTSHLIEHIANCYLGLLNWWRILKPGGYLIINGPHRDLYEKNRELPSRWNYDHKFFLLPEKHDLPFTIGLRPLVLGALPDAEIIYIQECRDGHTIDDPLIHSDGEYSIEMVIRKPVQGS
ncbi:MAG: methyltransferase domain-containing protein [Armatimonadetes bacterium]|nr:methyltransferase domain-containing protein [Armatimonadota bacterium]